MVLLPALLLLQVVFISSQAQKDRLQKKFFLLEPQKQITDALAACKRNYTDLVTIYDQVENANHSEAVVKGSYSCSWIGANGCTWSNGDPVTFINFSRNFTEERCCGALTAHGAWECFNCSSKMYFMCHKQDHILISLNKTWIEAQLYCTKNQSNLVSITNEMENERVKEAVNGSDSVWIGFQYNYKVVWSDDGYSHYKEDVKAACLTFLPNNCSTRSLSTCAPLCYKRFIYVSTEKKSWEAALNYCMSYPKKDGLLRIQSEDDQREVERELKRQNITEPVWVGLRKSRLFGFWIWSSGLMVGPWTNWQDGRKDPETSYFCGALEKNNGTYMWSDKDCRLELRFLCEVK
ncbi:macrophage mannose receptor 1 isoform X2 [Carassius auratus]|uniref:Macrophage mannose receptor 1 isoform X2 n=1 Tax=Carassius auratus TaxID=7957 RepID=A0A6P6M4V2_CARAU|nr:macrophage mannose receptor 1-like isoform X2 [Carassius auratus]